MQEQDYYWPNRNALDAHRRIGDPDGSRFRVVGIVGDVRNQGLDAPTAPEIYLLSQLTSVNPMHLVVRSALPPQTLVPEIRSAVQSVDPTLPIHGVTTMNQIVRQSLALQRIASFMTGFFALAALLMATLGVYGVVAYSVRRRTVEMGTRMALGAGRRDVVFLVMGGGLKMAAYRVAAGSIVVVAAGWPLLRVFDIGDFGYLPVAYSTAIVAGVTMAASFFPAWRASLLSPMVAIRDDPRSVW